MSWDKDSLIAKAILFYEKASNSDRESMEYGLWCSFGLESLIRASISSVSPVLLAEPDRDHKNTLFALGKSTDRKDVHSITTVKALELLKQLFPEITTDDTISARALINRRNEELHTGTASFAEYSTGQWLVGFYRITEKLSNICGIDVSIVVGKDDWKHAIKILKENRDGIKSKIESTIAAHKRVFDGKDENDKNELRGKSEKNAIKLSFHRHHKAKCPSCGCSGLLTGEEVGKGMVIPNESEVIVKQPIAPDNFNCIACGLKLSGHSELEIVGLASHYTRTSTFTPEEYYGLINEDDIDWDEKVRDYLKQREYDNE